MMLNITEIAALKQAASALDTLDLPVIRMIEDALLIGVGSFIWVLVWGSYKRTVQLHTAVFGDPDDPKPNGLKRDMAQVKVDCVAAVQEARSAVEAVAARTEQDDRWRGQLAENMSRNADRVQHWMTTLSEKVDTLTERRRRPR